MGRGPSDVPSTSHQMFWMTPLCIHHHSPPFGIWICKWCHFSLWYDLYLWGSSGGLWWYCLLCNAPVPHIHCICSSYSCSGLWHMVGPCRVCSGLCCFWCFLFFLNLVFWVPWSCFSPCWGPNWGTYFLSGPFLNDVLLVPKVVVLNWLLFPYGVGYSPHYTLLQWYGGYPTTNINLCGLVFYIPLCSNCHLDMEWPKCLERVWTHLLCYLP